MKPRPFFSKLPRKSIAGIALAFLVALGAIAYYIFNQQSGSESEESTLQTAQVRRGDLTIFVSGTGTLSTSNEIELSFTASGEVTDVYVKPGDKVEAGDLLATMDDAEARAEYMMAKNTYTELTSQSAVAAALQEVSQSRENLDSANLDLEYLISPEAMYWEQEVTEAKEVLRKAKNQARLNPTDEYILQQRKDAEAYLDFAEDMLYDAWDLYEDEYIPEHFLIVRNGEEYSYAPTDLEILQARIAIQEAEVALEESTLVYEVLTGSGMPENTSIDRLLELQDAQRAYEQAQVKLGGTQIIAPTAGTIMSVNITPGNQSGADTAITLAELSQPNMDVYVDESDWNQLAVGYKAEVIFDSLPEKVFSGEVSTVDAELYKSGNSSAVHGEILLDASFDEIHLPIGAAASVDVISASAEDVLLIPVEALHETNPGKYAVFVVTQDGLRLRVIEVGLQNEIYAEVKAGLDDDQVVTTGISEVD